MSTNDGITTALRAKADDYPEIPEKARAFAVHYAIEPIGRKAARLAGYTKFAGDKAAGKWLRDRRVVSLIQELRALIPDVRPLDPNAIQSRLGMLAMTDVASMLVPDERYPDNEPPIYRWKRPEELTPGERALVQHVQMYNHVSKDEYDNEVVTQTFGYKVLSNKDSLDSLARTFGMFRDRVEHEHKHKIDAVFKFIAERPETSETVARLNAKYGRVIPGEAKEVES